VAPWRKACRPVADWLAQSFGRAAGLGAAPMVDDRMIAGVGPAKAVRPGVWKFHPLLVDLGWINWGETTAMKQGRKLDPLTPLLPLFSLEGQQAPVPR
jgi:hypothetical protein